MMKCHDCGKETEHLALVKSTDINNALMFVCLTCATEKGHDVNDVTTKCNRCDKKVTVGKGGNLFMELVVDEKNFVIHCRGCSVERKTEDLKRSFGFLNEAKIRKILRKERISTFFAIESIKDEVLKRHPYAILSLFANGRKLEVFPSDGDPDVAETILDILR